MYTNKYNYIPGAYSEFCTGGGARFKIYTYIAQSALPPREARFRFRAKREQFW